MEQVWTSRVGVPYGFLKVGLATFAGYGDYQKVEIKWDKHTALAVQESFSTRVPAPTCIEHVIGGGDGRWGDWG